MKKCTYCAEEKELDAFYTFQRKLKNGTKEAKTSRCKQCMEKVKTKRNTVRNIRLGIIERLGSKCVKCGFADIRALQIDHINGGGKKEILSFNNNFRNYYKHIRSSDLSLYQLLCANCNWIKRYENNECKNDKLPPHCSTSRRSLKGL